MKYFANQEADNSSIDDDKEGLWMNKGFVTIPGICKLERVENIRHSYYLFCVTGSSDNVYCEEEPYQYYYPEIPEGEMPIGDWKLLVWNPNLFCRRFYEAVRKEGLSVISDWVKYDIKSEKQYDTGELYQPFHKRVKYYWQSEYRFCVAGDIQDDKKFLNLGPLTDIACIMKPDKAYKMAHRFDNRYDFVSE
ncbi:MAG: hypothetical protein IK022_02635 [Bacteroidales bacterium]|nr:hypothetical protein [Bacteroidales bacterium]